MTEPRVVEPIVAHGRRSGDFLLGVLIRSTGSPLDGSKLGVAVRSPHCAMSVGRRRQVGDPRGRPPVGRVRFLPGF